MNYHSGQISFLIAYYNEEKYLEETLILLLKQERRPDQIVLVNNASTDSSESIAYKVLEGCLDVRVVHLTEERKGKVNALEKGFKYVDCEFVSLGDADTKYPATYLSRIEKIFGEHSKKCVAAMALPRFKPGIHPDDEKVIAERIGASKWFKSKCFTGGFGQTIRSEVLREVGGFSHEKWPYCLMDHEIMNRVLE
jgi:cellulose synthase/poly-beta-1,6-N-acetylglucosamine synthase-like glycosyltransferase